MQTQPENDITDKLESGEYFREARNAFANVYLDPMVERYLYLVITVIAVAIFTVALAAIGRLFPLETHVPFTFMSSDMTEELPVMQPLAKDAKEDPNLALKRFLVGQYVTRRESYNIDQLELNVRAVKSQSSQEVFDLWQKQLDPNNSESPISQYQRHSVRSVSIVDTRLLPDGSMEVLYDATVDNRQEQRKARFAATVAFTYTDVTIDQHTGAMTRLEFLVTGYSTKRLQQ